MLDEREMLDPLTRVLRTTSLSVGSPSTGGETCSGVGGGGRGCVPGVVHRVMYIPGGMLPGYTTPGYTTT